MLARLYALPDAGRYVERTARAGISVRRVAPADATPLRAFVEERFGARWADGVPVALSRQPLAAFVALEGEACAGFALYDVAHRMYFGPMGVREDLRGCGIGAVLLIRSLDAMAERGYAYAIIGDVGPVEFYERVCGATVIPDSDLPAAPA